MSGGAKRQCDRALARITRLDPAFGLGRSTFSGSAVPKTQRRLRKRQTHPKTPSGERIRKTPYVRSENAILGRTRQMNGVSLRNGHAWLVEDNGACLQVDDHPQPDPGEHLPAGPIRTHTPTVCFAWIITPILNPTPTVCFAQIHVITPFSHTPPLFALHG